MSRREDQEGPRAAFLALSQVLRDKPPHLHPPDPPKPRVLAPPTAAPLPTPQKCIDWNRAVLKRELGLTERDIVDIPQLFKLIKDSRGTAKAEAFFPNMVRMRTSKPTQLRPQS